MLMNNHTKIFIKKFSVIFLPLSALLAVVLGSISYGKIRAERTALKISEIRKVDMQAKVIARDFSLIISDLMIIAGQIELQELLEGYNKQQNLAKEFLFFSQYKKLYDQIRFLDKTGKEVVRVNFNQGQSSIVPQEQLQVQLKRYWFKDTLRLKQGEVFVSPLDLNIERGEIEQPLKPMIRFGTPVFDNRGQKRGIVVLNYLGNKLLDNFAQVNEGSLSQAMLLNIDGYWLKGAKSDDEWGFMFPNRQNRTFSKAFPRESKQIFQKESGQFQTPEGLFTFTTVYPLLEGQKSSTGSGQAFVPSNTQIDNQSYYWKIVSQVPPKTLNFRSNKLLTELLLLYVGLVGVIAIGSWLLARANVHHQISEMELHQSQARLLELAERENLLKNRLSSHIRNSLELDTILSTAVVEVCKLLQIDRCQFWWCHPEAESTWLEQSHEACNPKLSTPLGYYPIENVEALVWTILHGKLLRLDNIVTDTQLETPTQEFLLSLGLTSLLAVAIPTHSSRAGILICEQSRIPHPWSDDEVELLLGVADQLAIAIDQAELYSQSRAATEIATVQAEKLQEALQQLQQTQAQLIQTEKMSSLGQLVAGIAHEINNPVNFIFGNLTHVKEDVQHLLELVELYHKSCTAPSPELQTYIENIDLDFIIEDLPKMLTSMRVGSDRIRQIVLSLRNFSRLEEADMKCVNIHEGIDNTLLILQHRLKDKSTNTEIKIIKKYGDIPLIECYPGQLNQVFMNLLSNAIDALENYKSFQAADKRVNSAVEEMEVHHSQITICTHKCDQNHITIQIADNGSGIPETTRKKIFDPFFTTKPVGKGTGLGLSISYQIVTEKHRGAIWCISEPRQGAEFWIKLPIAQNF